jgi:hypothetical protein
MTSWRQKYRSIEVTQDLVRQLEIGLCSHEKRIDHLEPIDQLALEGPDIASRRAKERPGKLRALSPFASEQNRLLHRQEQLPRGGISMDRLEALRLERERRIGKLSRLLQLSGGCRLALALGRKERVPFPQHGDRLVKSQLLRNGFRHWLSGLRSRGRAEERDAEERG